MTIDNRDVFLEGRNLVLKVLTENDVRNSGWYGWFNDPRTTAFMQQGYFPNCLEKQLAFFQGLIHSTTKLQLGILPKGSDQIIGVISLAEIDLLHRKAELSIIIGDQTYRGRGVGTEAIRLLLGHAFGKLSLNKVGLGVHAGHQAAIRSYQKAGFKIEGRLREELSIGGKGYDVIRMGILAKEFWQDATEAESS